jgi:hypothetical protein
MRASVYVHVPTTLTRESTSTAIEYEAGCAPQPV